MITQRPGGSARLGLHPSVSPVRYVECALFPYDHAHVKDFGMALLLPCDCEPNTPGGWNEKIRRS